MIPACVRLGVTFVPYFPLASGLLTGKYRRNEAAPEGTPARRVGRPRRRVPLRRALRPRRAARRVRARPTATRCPSSRCRGSRRNPAVASVIAGATSPEQVRVERRRDRPRGSSPTPSSPRSPRSWANGASFTLAASISWRTRRGGRYCSFTCTPRGAERVGDRVGHGAGRAEEAALADAPERHLARRQRLGMEVLDLDVGQVAGRGDEVVGEGRR